MLNKMLKLEDKTNRTELVAWLKTTKMAGMSSLLYNFRSNVFIFSGFYSVLVSLGSVKCS